MRGPLPPDHTTLRRITAFANDWRRGGWRWLTVRAIDELGSPLRLLGKLYRVASVAFRVGLPAFFGPRKSDGTTLTVFYDLEVSPTTFDVLWALAAAECRRLEAGIMSIRFVVVPGRYRGVRHEHPDYEAAIPVAARIARIEQILLACARLVPSVTEAIVARDRRHAEELRLTTQNVYPADYWPQIPAAHHPRDLFELTQRFPDILRAPPAACAAIAAEFDGLVAKRRLVTITLRSYAEAPDRNSAVDQWVRFAASLDPAVYQVVFVPDTQAPAIDDVALQPFPVARSASREVALRLALYERAWLNMFVNNGPYALCAFSARCRYVMLKVLTPGVPQASATYLQELGFEIGGTPPGANACQRWIWADDSAENIRRAFEEMAQLIEVGRETVAGPGPGG